MTNSRRPLTQRQRAILSFIEDQTAQQGYPPSVREIGEAVGLSSSSTVHSHLRSLEKKGYLRRDPSKPRALAVIGRQGKKDDSQPNGSAHGTYTDQDNVRLVPLLGRVAAGLPILATENVEDSLPLPARFVGNDSSFMLEVRGDSMIDAGIFDGDYVVVRQQSVASNGEIVVAMIEDEATVKRFYKESDHVRLVAENSSYDPILTSDVAILGKVIAVFRSL